MNRGTYFLALAALLLFERAAWAGNTDAKDRAALTACLSGDYAKGVALLTELCAAKTPCGPARGWDLVLLASQGART